MSAINSNRNRIQKYENLAKLKEYKKGLKCEQCGENHPACLDFHHTVPKTSKELSIGQLIRNNRSWNSIMSEINKLQVLCSNCHRKIHWCVKCECLKRKCKCDQLSQ